MDRTCPSCGADPGAGSFCQHCGTRLAADEAPNTPDPPLAAPPPPVVPPLEAQLLAAPPPGTPAAPPPAAPAGGPTPPILPATTKRSRWGIGCLIAALIAVAVLVVGGFLVWRFVTDRVVPGIQETLDDVVALQDAPPGPCYDLETDGDVLTGWTEVSCDGPRQFEVSFAASFDDGPFPGNQYLTNTATSTCTAAFETYIGVSPEQSVYGVYWLLPTKAMWAGGSRQGICLVVSKDDSDLVGTIKGSGT